MVRERRFTMSLRDRGASFERLDFYALARALSVRVLPLLQLARAQVKSSRLIEKTRLVGAPDARSRYWLKVFRHSFAILSVSIPRCRSRCLPIALLTTW
jgi:hypothetical protein